MKLLIITHVLHKHSEGCWFAYGPYMREIELWGKSAETLLILAPVSYVAPGAIDLACRHPNIRFIPVPALNFSSFPVAFRSLMRLPLVLWRMFTAMRTADHIHVRCPGNIGLLGCLVQIFFPKKRKTAKYAGNWDWNSRQPWSYRLQQRLLQNTWITRNMTALIYGEWPGMSRNLTPFFTASYHQTEALPSPAKVPDSSQTLRFVFAGTLTPNKRPQLALQTAGLLIRRGYQVQLDVYGAGNMQPELAAWVSAQGFEKQIHLHGNVSAERLAEAFRQAHFLLFASQSEGWPKAVAEAMFWGCLPLTTAVSCIPQMLDHGYRGDLVPPDPEIMAERIEYYLKHPEVYQQKTREALEWSRQFTLEKMELEIHRLLA